MIIYLNMLPINVPTGLAWSERTVWLSRCQHRHACPLHASPSVSWIFKGSAEWVHSYILGFTLHLEMFFFCTIIHRQILAWTIILFLGLFCIIVLTLYLHVHSSPRFLWCSIRRCADSDLAYWLSCCSSNTKSFPSPCLLLPLPLPVCVICVCPWLTMLPHSAISSNVTSPERPSLITHLQ